MKRDFLEDLIKGKYSGRENIADIEPYLLEGIPYGLPINASAELRRYIAAAIFKHINPEKDFEEIVDSLDIDNYSDEKNVSHYDGIIFAITNAVEITTCIMKDLFQKLVNNKPESITHGEILFFSSLTRLKQSFNSTVTLLRYGYFVEVITVFRLIYEQLCWACFVIDENSDKNIINNKTTSNTKYLKEKINKEYGKFYDDLSKGAHLAPKTIAKYLSLGDEGLKILERSGKKCKEEISYLILLFRIYIEVFQYSINEHFELEDVDKKYYNDFIYSQLILHSKLCENFNSDKICMPIVKKL
ncbi:hypothetical protein F3J09_20020 [Bacillus sp. Ab-1751]|uniref:hypothetical protein n=1 Tax=Bacillus TaxID=1386 RepID=UPI000BF7F313|nr:hypothetical protein [Bacillus cereus]NIE93043.1 hypothetical protein [Bacillus sp. Ab-1751]PFQ30071.1 hypothetical protein COK33_28635 [Bacillus cereus]PGX56988.1 hypothetical protein COE29_15905 [Bacillus cereus]